MSFISEQVRKIAEQHENLECVSILQEAADTIESLSAKLQAANMECQNQKGNYSIGDLSELIDKFDNENIKGLTGFEQTQVFNALKYLDMYQKVGTIESFMEWKKNMERPAEDCGGWTLCEDRLPEERDSMFAKFKGTDKWDSAMFEKISDEVNVTVEFKDGKRKTMTLHACDGKWRTDMRIVKFKVIAWQPLPEPYHEP